MAIRIRLKRITDGTKKIIHGRAMEFLNQAQGLPVRDGKEVVCVIFSERCNMKINLSLVAGFAKLVS